MKVRELIAALSRFNPDLPVVFDQDDIELVGQYVEVLTATRHDDLIYRDPKQYAADGIGYTRPVYPDSTPTEPVVLLTSQRYLPVIEGSFDEG